MIGYIANKRTTTKGNTFSMITSGMFYLWGKQEQRLVDGMTGVAGQGFVMLISPLSKLSKRTLLEAIVKYPN